MITSDQCGGNDQRIRGPDLSALGQGWFKLKKTKDSEENYLPPNLEDYYLARYRKRRTTKPPKDSLS